MLSKCVYTVNVNDYDFVFEPVITDDDIDYILFTDNPNVKSKNWIIKIIPKSFFEEMSPAFINRLYKFLPNKFLSCYDVSIYIDSNIRLINSISPLMNDFIEANCSIGFIKHPLRVSVIEEIDACVSNLKVVDEKLLQKEYEKYKSLGFTDKKRLTENSIILRRHNRSSVIDAMNLWWDYFKCSAGRDQISLPYVREKVILDEKIYDIKLRENNGMFQIYKHKTKNSFVNFKIYLSVVIKNNFLFTTIKDILN